MTDTPPGMASSWVDLSREIVAAGYMSPISPRRLTPSAGGGGGMPFGSETDYMRMLRQEGGWRILAYFVCYPEFFVPDPDTTIELASSNRSDSVSEPDTDNCSRSDQTRSSGSGFTAKFLEHWCSVPYPCIRIMLGHILSCSVKKPVHQDIFFFCYLLPRVSPVPRQRF
jgi:hypothetical protein